MLKGIDISHYNTLGPTSLNGLDFVFVKATDGTSVDAKYASHLAAVRKAGIIAGAYHFGEGGTNPQAQVIRFLSTAKGADLLALDLERSTSGPSMTNAQGRAFITRVHAAGRKIGLYHSRSGFLNLGQDWNWVAQWGSIQPNMPWTFWQYQGHPLDREYFNGTKYALLRLAGKAVLPAVSAVTITALRKLITNLASIASPTQAQKDKLGLYRARLIEYLGRGR